MALAAIAFAGGCSSSSQPPPQKQQHHRQKRELLHDIQEESQGRISRMVFLLAPKGETPTAPLRCSMMVQPIGFQNTIPSQVRLNHSAHACISALRILLLSNRTQSHPPIRSCASPSTCRQTSPTRLSFPSQAFAPPTPSTPTSRCEISLKPFLY